MTLATTNDLIATELVATLARNHHPEDDDQYDYQDFDSSGPHVHES